MKKMLKTITLTFIMSLICCFYSFAAASFNHQPGFQFYESVPADGKIDINYSEGYLARITADAKAYLEYQAGTDGSWKESKAELTVLDDGKGHFNIIAPLINASSIMNTPLRIRLSSGETSDIFMITGNYSLEGMPDKLPYGDGFIPQVALTAGKDFYLSPDIKNYTDVGEIRWQRSTDGGQSYSTVATLTGADKTFKQIADCTMTGCLYRYAINPSGTETNYSIPYEVLVQEDYTVKDGSLVVTNAGPSGIMNDYLTGRLSQPAQWKEITSVEFGDTIKELGAGSFKDCAKLAKASLNKAKSIGNNAFENTVLVSVVIPETMQSIGAKAFSGCSHLMDVYMLNPRTAIAGRNSFPELRKTSDITARAAYAALAKNEHAYPVIYGYKGIAKDSLRGINETSEGSTIYTLASKTDLPFIQIGAINESGSEVYLDWGLTDDGAPYIKNPDDLEGSGLSIHIPKTVHGVPVKKIASFTKGDITYGTLGFDIEGESTFTLNELILPDNVTEIDGNALLNVDNIRSIYSFSTVPVSGEIYFVDSSSDGYTYSGNWQLRSSLSASTNIMDDVEMRGTDGDLTWNIDIASGVLTLSGTGRGTGYASEGSRPYNWFANEISSIDIEGDIKYIGPHTFSHFPNTISISCTSQAIEDIDPTAFEDIGTHVPMLGKRCTMNISNKLFDIIEIENAKLNALGNPKIEEIIAKSQEQLSQLQETMDDLLKQLETAPDEDVQEIEKKIQVVTDKISAVTASIESATENYDRCGYNFIITDSTISCGAGVKAEYSSSESLLTITGNGDMETFTSKTEVPWRCANSKIRYIVIENTISSISNYAFYDLTALLEVKNYGKAQKINGSPNVFNDVMRYEEDGETRYIVPVYTFADENSEFTDIVPSEEHGYRVMNLYLSKGKCGNDLSYYISLDGILIIEGNGDMFDFTEGSSPWFNETDKIKSISLPLGLTSIGDFAFEGLSVTDIVIPENVVSIGMSAFKDCTGIDSFTIDSNISSLGDGAFAGCSQLHALDINNENYMISDGFLIDKRTSRLIGYLKETLYKNAETEELYVLSTNQTVTIPENIEIIGSYSLYDVKYMTGVVIPEGVKEIKPHAFTKIDGLEVINFLMKDTTKVSDDSFVEVGQYVASSPSKYAVMYKGNASLEKALSELGYSIGYHDGKAVSRVVAVYTGPDIGVGNYFNKNDVKVTVYFASGEKKEYQGESIPKGATRSPIRIITALVTTSGYNYYTVTYDDGFGEQMVSEPFTVVGVRALKNISFSYSGTGVWIGDQVNPADIQARLEYADGSFTIVSGNSGDIELSSTTITSEKNNKINVVYTDRETLRKYSGTVTVPGKKYITKIHTTYEGLPVDYAMGIAGISKKDVKITLTWSDGTKTDLTGDNTIVEFLPDYTVAGSYIVFEYKITENNRFGYTGAFQAPFSSNVTDVAFDYIGSPVTKGLAVNPADIQITLSYEDKERVITADQVNPSDLLLSNNIIKTADSYQTVDISYTVQDKVFNGSVEVPGRIRKPLSLVIAKRPAKTVYSVGDAFDREGMICNCNYDNGEIENVTEKLNILNGGNLLSGTKYIVLTYQDTLSGEVVTTNLAINVNQHEREVRRSVSFKEQYEISKVLFRSKETEDTALINNEESAVGLEGSGENYESESFGRWIDITPSSDETVYDVDQMRAEGKDADIPVLKAGYGFELKVYVTYKTNREGNEFQDFLMKGRWDESFSNLYPDIAGEINTNWKYLNDVYPQATPLTSPDIIFMRIVNPNRKDETGEYETIKLNGGKTEDQSFIVMERTNIDETGGTDPSGNWYSSTKVFELPERIFTNKQTQEQESARRVYTSFNAKNDSFYVLEIATPPWMGYEPEPYYDNGTFIYPTDVGANYGKNWSTGTPFLGAVYAFRLKIEAQDDITTNILE